MPRKSVTILSATVSDMNKYSDPVQGDAYYGYADGFHTIQVRYNAFVGRLRVQASLALEPTELDWFDIIPEKSMGTAWNPLGYVQFNGNAPAVLSEAYTFRGNFTWMRCFMDRTHVGDGLTYDPSYGSIDQIIFSA
jgi:hypothetical protein